MLYTLIKILSIVSVRTFFNRVSLWHEDRIPKDGPVIFVSNHPNTMMDPLVLGISCKRDLHFLAKSTLFSNRIKRFFLNKLKLVPVYRKQDNPDGMLKNKDTFEKGFNILKNKGAFLIFPEGVSTGDRILEKIKTGAARIGFGAETKNNFKLGVKIIPVGLSYSDVIKFRSDVFVRFGKPIVLGGYKESFMADEKQTINNVTDEIETALNKLTTNVSELEITDLVECLELIYKKELILEMGLKLESKDDDFSVTKGLINAVEWYQEKYPQKVNHFRLMVARYMDRLDRLNISESFLGPGGQELTLLNRLKALSFLVLGFPIFLWGLLHNYLPYKFPRWITSKMKTFKSQIAPVKMLAGIPVFIVYYMIILSCVQWYFSVTAVTVLWGLSIIPSGNFVLTYLDGFNGYRQHLRFISLFYKERGLIFELIQERIKIIDFIYKAKEQYFRENSEK
jgi:1-acyl-sn-glycerol-3-phosphate acyltransferase